jgi:signal transduction histidine kinase
LKVLHGPEGQGRDRSGVLRILILEDCPLDAGLVGARLSEGGIGCELVRVQGRDAFAAALEEGGVDLILAASALENAWLYKELNDRERALQNLVKRLLGAQEEERRRVAYEVHDGLAQVAVAAHQNLQAFARRYAPETEQGRRELDRILGQVRTTVSDARRVIANLRPTALDDLGLAAAISLEVERLNEEGYQVDCEEHLGEERLPREMEIALFRVAQEALTNVRKHAGTKWLKIELQRRDTEVYLEVRDFGRGFDPAALQTLGGRPGERVGFAGMRERVGMLGGELEIQSRPEAGTFVAAIIPLMRTA